MGLSVGPVLPDVTRVDWLGRSVFASIRVTWWSLDTRIASVLGLSVLGLSVVRLSVLGLPVLGMPVRTLGMAILGLALALPRIARGLNVAPGTIIIVSVIAALIIVAGGQALRKTEEWELIWKHIVTALLSIDIGVST
jgi:hypothetical protein